MNDGIVKGIRQELVYFFLFGSCSLLNFSFLSFIAISPWCTSLLYWCVSPGDTCCSCLISHVADVVNYQIPMFGIWHLMLDFIFWQVVFLCASSVLSGPLFSSFHSLLSFSPVLCTHMLIVAVDALLDFGVYFSTCR